MFSYEQVDITKGFQEMNRWGSEGWKFVWLMPNGMAIMEKYAPSDSTETKTSPPPPAVKRAQENAE